MLTDTLREKNKVKTAKLRVVALDTTEHWREDIKETCEKIKTVYMYDENQHTYCCEIVPSYLLIPICHYAVTEKEISDEMSENLMVVDEEPSYYHVSSIDKLKTRKAVFSHHLDGGLKYTQSNGKKYNQILEAAQEYFRGNPPYLEV